MALAGQPCCSVSHGGTMTAYQLQFNNVDWYSSATFATEIRSCHAEIGVFKIYHHFEGLRPASFRLGVTLTGELIFYRGGLYSLSGYDICSDLYWWANAVSTMELINSRISFLTDRCACTYRSYTQVELRVALFRGYFRSWFYYGTCRHPLLHIVTGGHRCHLSIERLLHCCHQVTTCATASWCRGVWPNAIDEGFAAAQHVIYPSALFSSKTTSLHL